MVFSSPAVNDIRSFSRSDEVVQVSDEGNDWMRIVGHSKVRPPSVVELFHKTRLSLPSHDLEQPHCEVGQLLHFNRTDNDVIDKQ